MYFYESTMSFNDYVTWSKSVYIVWWLHISIYYVILTMKNKTRFVQRTKQKGTGMLKVENENMFIE
jgi:hypothetical protein